jgi:hypothetical protein
MSGFALLVVSAGAGALWEGFGPEAAFWAGFFARRWRLSRFGRTVVEPAGRGGRLEPEVKNSRRKSDALTDR